MPMISEQHNKSEPRSKPRPRGKPEQRSKFSQWRGQVPHVAGLVLALFSTITFLTSILPFLRHWTHDIRGFMDQYYFELPDTSLAWAVVVALLAAAVSARKRIGWWVLVLYLSVFLLSNIGQLVNDPDNPNAAVALAVHASVIAVLIVAKREFPTRVRRGSGRRALAVLIGGLAVGTLAGGGLVALFPGTLDRSDSLPWAITRVVLFSNADDTFSGHPHSAVNTVLGLFGALAVIAAAITLFRSQRADNALTGDDESLLRGLLARYSAEDSLGYFGTRRDKAVVFAANGRAAVTYRVEIGVCLASGDPIGDPAAWPDAIEAWLEQAAEYGWTPAVMGASTEGATAYDKYGLTALELGDEAILHTRTFNLAGRDMRPVRQAVTRIKRSGAVVRIRRHRDLAPEEMAEVTRLADAWRGAETERGFSMALGRLGDPADGECLLVETLIPPAEGAEPVVAAMLSFVPWGRTGVSLDLMRRDPRSPNGVVEFMTAELAEASETHGIQRISLNFAVFRSVFEEGARIGAGPILRAWRRLLLFFSRWWQLESLYRSNVKYQPQWEPRYLCFADNRLLPRISIASGIAEGYISVPKLSRHGAGHTGQRSSVPAQVQSSGLLHADGTGPDLPAELQTAQPEAAATGPRRPDQVRVRIAKAQRLVRDGVDPYPVAQQPTHTIADARAAATGTTVRVSGRLLRLRDHGGVVFALLRDWSGDIQLLADVSGMGAEGLEQLTSRVDLGDLVEVSGRVGASKSGELSLLVRDWRMNAKCLHPLPDKWRGLTDPEARVRSRYVDLAINPETRAIATARSAVLHSLRDSLHQQGFLEVETPILQQVHGGANARPFTTHINAYDLDLYLRIAPELYLKRLCVGGMDKVFELGRTFRNEGVDFSHNPEFTILEAYEAHSDYLRMMDTCRELIQTAAIAANGSCVIMRPAPGGPGGADRLEPVDISGKWPVITLHDAVARALGEDIGPETGVKELRRYADAAKVPWQPAWDAGAMALELYEHLVEGPTQEPTFYTDFPTSVSPLTRPHRLRAGVAERWDLVAYGVELGTAYSELTDPLDQRDRLTAQSLLAADGDPEAMELDEDFLRALEHGMPPTGGLGMGVDRVVMLITGKSIRETLPFPLAKPR